MMILKRLLNHLGLLNRIYIILNKNKMEEIKKEIIEILRKYTSETYEKGSCGELGELCTTIDSENIENIATDLELLFNER
jgi:hypothetical protein